MTRDYRETAIGLKKNHWLSLIKVVLICCCILICCLLYRECNWFAIFINFLFVTGDNKLNWLGPTALITVISLAISAWDSKRNYRADLISKNRIKWMNIVRPIIANYVESTLNYIFKYRQFAIERRKEYLEQLTNQMAVVKNLYYQLMLYIPRNESNKMLLKNIDLIFGELRYIGDYYGYGIGKGKFAPGNKRSHYDEVVDKYINDVEKELIAIASEYFKQEWEKAKRGA